MSFPVFFRDLSKRGKDLLSKNFPTQYEVKADTKAENGVTVETKLTRANDGAVAASVKPTLPFTAIGGSVETTVHSNKQLDVEVSSKNKVVDGLTTKLRTTVPAFDSSANAAAALDLDYKHERAAVTSSFDLLNPKSHGARMSAVLPYNDFAFGVDADVALSGAPELKRIGGVVNHKAADHETSLGVRRTDKSQLYGVNYYHQVSNGIELATDVSFDAAREKATPELVFGGAWRADAGSTVKARVGTNGRVGLAYITDFTRNLRMTFGLDVAAADTRDHKVGVSFHIHD